MTPCPNCHRLNCICEGCGDDQLYDPSIRKALDEIARDACERALQRKIANELSFTIEQQKRRVA
jgi:hypothetical protein